MSGFAQVLTLWREGRRAQAAAALGSLLAREPDHLEGLRFLAELRNSEGRLAEEVQALRRLSALCPTDAGVHRQLGLALLQSGASAEATAVLRHAVKLDPANARAHNNLGLAMLRSGEVTGSLQAFGAAIALDPTYALAHFNRGLAKEAGDDRSGAQASYREALVCEPHLAQARLRLAELLEPSDAAAARLERWRAGESTALNLMMTGRHTEARAVLTRLLEDGAELSGLEGLRFHCELWDCDWAQYDARRAALESGVQRGLAVDLPFNHFVYSDAPGSQRKCAEVFVAHRFPPRPGAPPRPAVTGDGRLTIAYLSSDLHRHATAYLMAGLLEAHDRTRFRIIAASFGPDDRSDMRARLGRAVDEFIDLRTCSDQATSEALRARGVHLAIDLKGHTGGARTGVLARRVAPVQVNFLGYPGTMGAPYIDYLIADRVVIPPSHRQFYGEQIVELPGCYQPNDPRRPRPATGPTRAAAGLPEAQIVFCCFNHTYKISPQVFAVWLRFLRAVPDSVLWLLQGSPAARDNLRTRAAHAGVSPERIVFAPHLELEAHLARYHCADLFLDTWPCNAHTTASDALWMGVPVVTLTGTSFPSRVAASLLASLQVDELSTSSLEAYETLALRLARDASERIRLRERLETAARTAELFDARTHCRRLERAYLEMWSRHERGLPPAAIVIDEPPDLSAPKAHDAMALA